MFDNYFKHIDGPKINNCRVHLVSITRLTQLQITAVGYFSINSDGSLSSITIYVQHELSEFVQTHLQQISGNQYSARNAMLRFVFGCILLHLHCHR
jgi:hypothetical protein